ncbi:hypothetical protein ETAA8_53320 [Anatilimnocola aggregata]|uniref:Uncharacterized protein n=1 Tax=Anatilimnocola aggregata TaxID=2528021 RepID=A0A517YJ05_9BACT|nr:hypothetical protein [Anatilimnocola aggregata]QDU30213.1 hypothetical protein ETAA8_53320 [Anatilimnocola aggregata]
MVAIVTAARDQAALAQVATERASQLTQKDIDKLPDRWAPAFSAKKAGAPELKDAWEQLWFEALTEILIQLKLDGLPHLLLLMDRNDSTYHNFVIVRLLRLAAQGIEPTMILDRIRRRLGNLQHVWTLETVRETVYWTQVDPRPLELLRPMSDIVVPHSDGDTVGTFIARMEMELPVHLARRKAQGL